MAYQTGSALDTVDLLDKLRLFLAANGWTVDFFGLRTASAADGKNLSVSKAGVFATFRGLVSTAGSNDPGPHIDISTHPAYSVGATPDIQVGQTAWTRSNDLRGPFQGYHFFVGQGFSGPYAHVALEVDAGRFAHFGIGVLRKAGDYVGGFYGTGTKRYFQSGSEENNLASTLHSYPFDQKTQTFDGGATIVRATVDGVARHLQAVGGDRYSLDRLRCGYRFDGNDYCTITLPAYSGASTFTGRANLIPLWCAAYRGGLSWSPLGYPDDMRYVDMRNLSAGEEIALGPDTWKCFPVIRKVVGTDVTTPIYGMAYRKVA